MNSEFWDERYSSNETVYGHEPNLFFRNQLLKSQPGKLLLPAEGEGRNALFAGQIGWQVEAFDFSKTAQQKALALANQFQLSIDYSLADIDSVVLKSKAYDAIGLIYVHLPPDLRKSFHKQCIQALRPGGTLILEAFSKKQLTRSSGGPKDAKLLYTLEDLLDDFNGMQILYSKTEEVTLSEGPFHEGESSVVRIVARKDKDSVA